MNHILVIYHGHCTDGFGAAYSAWKKFGDTADYLGMVHDQSPPDVTGKTVYILDFSFKKHIYEKLLLQAKEVILLDHHKTAQDSLEGCQGCYFDLSRSGAMIAWNYFHPDTPAPTFIKYIQDFDLFQFQYSQTVLFYRAINTISEDFVTWSHLENDEFLNQLLEKGKILNEFFQTQIQHLVKNAKPITLFGQTGLMVNAPWMFAAEIGSILAERTQTYALIWHESNDSIKCSLRSVKGYDCSTIATRMNGGGHPQACAFRMNSLQEFLNLITPKKSCFLNNFAQFVKKLFKKK